MDAFLVAVSGNFGHDAQAQGGRGAGDKLTRDLDGLENDRLQGAGDVAEQAVLDWVLLGTAGRIVSHLNVALQVGSQVTQLLFEQMLTVAVAAAAIAQ